MLPKELGRIEDGQREILDSHVEEQPVKLGQLAKDLGVDVKVAVLDGGISGQISREDDRYVIRVNRYEARERQRFTIVHELAHFLLHRPIIDRVPDGIKDNVLYRSDNLDEIEYEANRLAAHILMPTSRVKEIIEGEYGGAFDDDATVESLAASFRISKAAMGIRLSGLFTGA